MMNRRSICGLMAVVAVCLAATVGNAETILVSPSINNGSFESPVVHEVDGVFHDALIAPAGWGGKCDLFVAGTTTNGVWNVTASDGNQAATLAGYSGISYINLNLTETFKADTTYRLDMDASLGSVNTAGATATGTVTLYEPNGVHREAVVVTTDAYATGSPTGPWTVNWAPIPTIELNTALRPEFVGSTINIEIWNPRTDMQFWVDNVTLTETANVPEPSTLFLLATGVMGILVCGYRKQK